MKQPTTKNILKSFDNRIGELTEDNIVALSKNDASIFNVISYFHKEAFGALVWDDSKSDFDYYLTYVTNENKKIEGLILKLNVGLKISNYLVLAFATYISERFKEKNTHLIFNTYQDQRRTILEKYGYWTYGDDLIDHLHQTKGEAFIKTEKGTIYIPFANEKLSAEKKLTKPKEEIRTQFVYLMHNRRNNYYKIGRSINVTYRERTLQAEDPDVVLIASWEATAEVEKELHKKFSDKRIRGEWFKLSQEDIRFIEQIINNKY